MANAKISFQTNIIEEVALKFPTGKEVESQFDPSGKQFMFTTVDDRVFFASSFLADKIAALQVQAGEPLEIGRMEVMNGKRKSINWHVARVGYAPGENPGASVAPPAPAVRQPQGANGNDFNGNNGNKNGHGELPVPRVAAPANGNGTNGNGANGHSNGNGLKPSPLEHPAWAAYLREQTQLLIDVYATCVAYASSQYGNTVKPEDVRALLTTTFINLSQKGGTR